MTTAQIHSLPEPAQPSSSRRPALEAAAQVVFPVAQERFSARLARVARVPLGRADRSGALPSSGMGLALPAVGRARVLRFA